MNNYLKGVHYIIFNDSVILTMRHFRLRPRFDTKNAFNMFIQFALYNTLKQILKACDS